MRWIQAKRLLLVSDNFEHVIDAAELVGGLHSACPGVTILATSREALDLASEHRVVVLPLARPAVAERTTIAEIESTAASALFLARRPPPRQSLRGYPHRCAGHR
jgi:predicted ATPase